MTARTRSFHTGRVNKDTGELGKQRTRVCYEVSTPQGPTRVEEWDPVHIYAVGMEINAPVTPRAYTVGNVTRVSLTMGSGMPGEAF